MLNRFTSATQDSEISEALQEDGYAIIEGLLNSDQLQELNSQIAPHLGSTDPDAANAFMGEKTKRFGRLLLRVSMTRDLVRHPKVLAALDATLKPYGPTYQIHFTGVMHVMAGQGPQILHHDSVPFVNPAPNLVVATMWAATDFTKDNGATVFVPGSHKWTSHRVPKREELCRAEMPAGSVLLYLGNLIHGAGRSVAGHRTGVSLQYSVGWLRQEENQYLAVPTSIARTFDEDLQRLMGYDLALSNWGYVDQEHALTFLRRDGAYRSLDPEEYRITGRIKALQITEDGLHPGHRYDVDFDD